LVVEETRRTVRDLPSWKEGMEAFAAGDYPRAGLVFEALTQGSQDGEARRVGLYALACTRMAGARTHKEFQEAVALWEQWRHMAPPDLRLEDPRMLTPLLRRVPSPTRASARPTPRAHPEESPDVKRLMQSKDDEIRAREEQIQAKEEEIRAKEGEVRQLKEQLEALESIHRQIDEKKRGVSSR
jgi:hypothetical protein